MGVFPSILLSLVGVLLLTQHTVAKKGFLVTLPRHLRANGEVELCFTFSEYTGIDLKASVKFYAKEWRDKEKEQIGETRDTFHDGVGRCISMTVPPRPGYKQVSVGVEIVESERVWDPEAGAYVTRSAKAETEVKISDESQLTFIQTDKPIYKPGQKVQFRILTVDDKFMPVKQTIPLVWVEDAQDSRVSQWRDVTSTNGLISLSFPLSSDPNLGQWRIKAKIGDQTEVKDFKVIEYVLPKFEVRIVPPSMVFVDQPEIPVKVCAIYSYGQPVRGQLAVTVGIKKYYGLERDRPTFFHFIEDFYDCAEIKVPSSDLQLDDPRWSTWSTKLHVQAELIEQGTDVMRSRVDESVSISYQSFELSVDGSAKHFKPFMPFEGIVSAKLPDGSALAGKELLVKVDLKEKIMEKIVTTDAKGVAPFTIPHEGLYDSVTSFSVSAHEPSWRPNRAVYPPPPGSKVEPESPSRSFQVEKWFSPSGSYVKILPTVDVTQPLSCDAGVSFKVYYTSTEKKVHHFHYQILSRGRIVKTGIKQHFFRPSPLDASNFDDDRTLNINVKPTTTTTTTTTTTSTPSAEVPSNITEFKIVEPHIFREPNLLSATAAPIPYLEPSFFPLEIGIEPRMSPGIKLVVYYIRDDGEIVADSIKLKIKPCFNNDVKLSYREKKDNRVDVDRKMPGEGVKIRLEAASESLCALGIVDKSVHILGGENQLNLDKVFEALSRIDTFDRYEYDYPGEHKYCQDILEERRKKEKEEREEEKERRRNATIDGDASSREKRSVWWPRSSSRNFVDSLQAFKDTSLAILTDLTLQTRPCFSSPYDLSIHRNTGVYRMESVPNSIPAMSGASPGDKPISSKVAIRSYFPETWLWHLYEIGSSGVEEFSATLPHAITEWVGSAFCSSPKVGLGIANDARITAFQPFFVSYTLPYAAVRGEKLPLKVTVFNYLSKCLTVRLLLKQSHGFKVVGGEERERHLCVCGGKSKTEIYKIVPTLIGSVNVTVRAASVKARPELCVDPDNNDVNVDKKAIPEMADASFEGIRDAIVKPLLVEAEGIPQDYSMNDLICPETVTPKVGNTPIWDRQIHLDIPPATQGYVEDSARGEIVVIGDVMGSAMSNIDSLLAMPYGCGEQNMVNFVPNIFIMRYLEATGRQDPKIKDKALNYLTTGYQRELTYQHPDGSYSAFGPRKYPIEPDIREEWGVVNVTTGETNVTTTTTTEVPPISWVPPPKDEGSLWLTAFVVKSFAQAQSYIYISSKEIAKSVKFLRRHQKRDGSFPVVGKLFSKSLKGGLATAGGDEEEDAPNVGLTAYTLISLLEANLTRDDPMIVIGFNFLGTVSLKSVDTYTCAVVTYAFCLLDPKSTEATDWITELELRAKTEEGERYWPTSEPDSSSSSTSSSSSSWESPWKRSSAADVEATGYALLSLIARANALDKRVVDLNPIVKWMTKQRNQFGGYHSTQDTVVGIQALAEYAAAIYGGVVNLQVRFRQVDEEPEEVVKFDIDASNALLLNVVPLAKLPAVLQVQGKGSGCAVLQTNIRYNIQGLRPSLPKFELTHRTAVVPEPPSPEPPSTAATSAAPSPPPEKPSNATDASEELLFPPLPPPPSCTRVALEACARYIGADGVSNMALLEVKMVTGWVPIKKSLEKARSRGRISKYEVDGNRLQIYFDRLTAIKSCVSIGLEREMELEDAKPATIRLYDYYEPSEVVASTYEILCRRSFIPPFYFFKFFED